MLGIFAALIANIIWGAGSPIFKYALTDIPPFTLAFIRFFTAAFIFLPFALRHMPRWDGKVLMYLLLGACSGVTLNVALFFIGLELAPSINASIIGSLGPIMLYVLSLRVLHEKPHAQIIRGMLIALVGTLIIIFAPLIKSFEFHTLSEQAAMSAFTGNLFFLGAVVVGILYNVFNKKIVKKVHPYTMTGIHFFIGSLAFIPLMLGELQTWSFTELTGKAWIGIIYGVFFSSAIAYGALNFALSKMTAQSVGVFGYIAPVAAVLVAGPLLGEYPDIFFIVGSIFVIVGIYLAERHPQVKRVRRK